MQEELLSIAQVADILSISKDTLRKWDNNGTLVPQRQADNNYRVYRRTDLLQFEAARSLFQNTWEAEMLTQPLRPYTLVELFAGAGGLAIGMEKSGFNTLLLNELDKHACQTLRQNRPHWNIAEGSISGVSFKHLHGTVDLLTGGFPCQAFSYAGKKMGFEDTRGTLFFEFARAVKEISPKILLAENVRGLQKHDDGNTLKTIRAVIAELGYTLIEPRILKALFYQVPQKRERLILVGIRNDLAPHVSFSWPSPYKRIMTMRDAMFAGELYPSDVPDSPGQRYPLIKEAVMAQVPAGGYWRDLPVSVQRDYMKKSFFLSGGKTGMARRLSWDEPSLTLTCAPAQKQTERCHPEQTRPLTVREYARIQTFPDTWKFSGPIGSQYKQIGNAVPVNLAHAIGRTLVRALNSLEKR